MLVNFNDMLEKAKKNKYAVPHFNINNLEWTKFILEECNKLNIPVILGVSEGAAKYMGGFYTVANIVKGLIKDLNINIDVCLHLDHGSSKESCINAIESGFTSVMIDASRLPIEENIKLTKEVVDYAHERNISVEAEVGHIEENISSEDSRETNATVEECIKLYEETINEFEHIDILINNAGFGLCGKFIETDLDTELSMIDTNIVAVHILMKLFLQDMVKRDSGYIMNVASIAGFMAGPLMATYYASKNYVVRISQAIRHELKSQNSKVKISCLCPGPVDTNFNATAHVKFSLKGANSMQVAKFAVKKMFKNKFFILPGAGIKITRFGSKILPDSLMSKFCYMMQSKKIDR